MDSVNKKSSIVKKNLDITKILAESKSRSIFVIAVTLLFTLILVTFAILPTVNAILKKIEDNNEILEATSQAERKVSDIKVMVAEKDNKQNLIGFFNQSFPLELAQDSFSEKIYEFAEGRVLISSIAFPEEYSDGSSNSITDLPNSVKSIIAGVAITGTRGQILDFLNELENSRRTFNVISVSYSRGTEDSETEELFSNEYVASVSIEYFYWLTSEQ